MTLKSPVFFLFISTIVGSLLSSFLSAWLGLIICVAAIVLFFIKNHVNVVWILSLFFFAVAWILAPKPLPNGQSFIIGKVSHASCTVAKVTDVRFHIGQKWVRGGILYVFLPRYNHLGYPQPGDLFMAQVEKENTVEAKEVFWTNSDAPIDRMLNWGMSESDRIYSKMKLYMFEEADTVASIFLGRRDTSFELKQAYRNGGYAHIFSVSGMHVGIIVAVTLILLSEFVPWNVFKYPLAFILVVVYGFVTGFSIPTFRAVAIFGIFTLFKIVDRPQNFLNILGMIGLFEVLQDGSIIFDVSFQLSYSAVIAMAILVPHLPKFKPKWLSEAMNFTFAANVGVIPFLILNYGKIYITSFIFNVTLVPILVMFILEGSLLFSAFATVGIVPLEKVVGAGVYPFAKTLDWVAYFTKRLPLSAVSVQPRVAIFWIIFSLVGLLLFRFLLYDEIDTAGISHRNSTDDLRF